MSFLPFLTLLALLLLPTTTLSTTTCSSISPAVSAAKYTKCTSLPFLSSTLHYTYTPSNKTLSVAFTATPPPSGYIAWGINPTGTGMLGAQALIAFNSPKDSSPVVATYNLTAYDHITAGPLSFPVYSKRVEFNAADKSFTIFAVVKSDGGKVNHVWQVGPLVNGAPAKHDMKQENLGSKATIDVSSAIIDGGSGNSSKSDSSSSSATSLDLGLKKRNTHGILNAISWGMLFPFGAIISRYLRTVESAEPAWFYLHATCQTSAYAIGVAGWVTGLQLGSESKGIVFKGHRCIGIVLFCLATVQICALFLRPNKDHKYRFYWNAYHHCVGYAIIILGIINVFKGFDILEPEKKWKSIYVGILIVLGGIAVLLEALTWIVVLRRKSRSPSKPYT
ncbi:cytochrome b561 and DOMON domain-containing protein At3g25290-like [Silene latifolia]|uniref:cytochrome b561 and DOMON domain-containing protein At3g25290-like n=1 Tax=Silene latifolia TaxID=37657 RepID=UPI003D7705A2